MPMSAPLQATLIHQGCLSLGAEFLLQPERTRMHEC